MDSQFVTCAVVVSGGMDSVTLLHLAVDSFGADNVHALSFDYGQRHSVELHCAAKQCKYLGVKHKIINLECLHDLASNSALTHGSDVPLGHYSDESMKQTVVPNRNMVMLSLALSYATNNKLDSLWYGAHSGDHTIYPDCRPEFVRTMQLAALLCDWHQVQLEAPFLHGNKETILNVGKELEVDYSQTWTCYTGNVRDGACGECGACTERLEAFAAVGLVDPIRYMDKDGVPF